MRITRAAKKRFVAREYALRHKRVERQKEPGGEFLGRYFGVGWAAHSEGGPRRYTGVSPPCCEEYAVDWVARGTNPGAPHELVSRWGEGSFLLLVRGLQSSPITDATPTEGRRRCCCRFSRERHPFSPTAVRGTSPLISIHTDSCSCAPARGRIWNILRLCGPPVLVASR